MHFISALFRDKRKRLMLSSTRRRQPFKSRQLHLPKEKHRITWKHEKQVFLDKVDEKFRMMDHSFLKRCNPIRKRNIRRICSRLCRKIDQDECLFLRKEFHSCGYEMIRKNQVISIELE